MYLGLRGLPATVREVDQRLAQVLRWEPLVMAQSALAAYVLLNHAVVEALLPATVRRRVRAQNLLAEVVMHASEVWGRLGEVGGTGRRAVFASDAVVSEARRGMARLVRSREGQQVAYALLCMLCGAPEGCVLPLIVRDVPHLLKVGGVLALACTTSAAAAAAAAAAAPPPPSRRKKGGKQGGDVDAVEHFFVVTPADVPQGAFDVRSSKNVRVVLDLACEGTSLGLEGVVLTGFLLQQFTDVHAAKAGLLAVAKRVVAGALILRYLQVRGLALGDLLVETLGGTAGLESVRASVRRLLSAATAAAAVGTAANAADGTPPRKAKKKDKKKAQQRQQQTKASPV